MSVRISRSAQASWQGTVPEGGGRIALDSGAYEGEFTLQNRVAEEVHNRTNPEELIAAAHAGCFTMSLANLLSEAGSPPRDLRTTARVRLEQKDEGFRITGSASRRWATCRDLTPIDSWLSPRRPRTPARCRWPWPGPRSRSRPASRKPDLNCRRLTLMGRIWEGSPLPGQGAAL